MMFYDIMIYRVTGNRFFFGGGKGLDSYEKEAYDFYRTVPYRTVLFYASQDNCGLFSGRTGYYIRDR